MGSNHQTAMQSMALYYLRNDAATAAAESRVPAVMRLRAEKGDDEHPLLALRLGVVQGMRVRMKQFASDLIDAELPLNTPSQRAALAKDIGRALQACLRVLECSDQDGAKFQTANAAKAMANSLGVIATLLQHHNLPDLMQSAQVAVMALEQVAQDVNQIAEEMKQAHTAMKVNILTVGERVNQAPADSPEVQLSR